MGERWDSRWWASIAVLSVVLFVASMGLPNVMIQCIEGCFHLGFPVPFYGSYSSPGVQTAPVWFPPFVILDFFVWLVVSWGILVVLRDREARTSC